MNRAAAMKTANIVSTHGEIHHDLSHTCIIKGDKKMGLMNTNNWKAHEGVNP